MANEFTVTLPEYIEQNKEELIAASVLGATSLTYPMYIKQGVKHKETINFGEVDAPFQAGGACAFNSSGGTTFTQKTLTVADLKVETQYCPKELEEKYTAKYLRPGVKQEALPVAQFITDQMNQKIASQMEKALWQGDVTNHTFDTNLKQFDGLIHQIDAASPVVATAVGAVTTSNVIAIVKDMYAKIPAQILSKDLVLIVGKDTFRTLVTALAELNYFHVAVSQGLNNWEMTFPFFNLKVVAVDGLSNIAGTGADYKDRMVLTYWDNLVFVTDLQNDMENYEMWFSKDDRVIKTSIEWKAGTAVKFGTEIVTYKRA